MSSRKAQHNENCVHVQELMRQQQIDAEAATRAHLEASVTQLHQQLELVLTGTMLVVWGVPNGISNRIGCLFSRWPQVEAVDQ